MLAGSPSRRWALGAVLVASVGAGCEDAPTPSVTPRSPVAVERSRVSSDRADAVAADGEDPVVVTVLVRDLTWQPVPGQTVVVQASGAGVAIVQPLPTDADGIATALVTGSVAGEVILTAGVATAAGLIPLAPQLRVSFVGGAVGASCRADGGCLGQLCVRGACRAACGTGPYGCGDGWLCVAGSCVPEGCAAVSCPADMACGADASCYPASCGGVACGPFELCADERCIDRRCAGVSCDAGAVCLFGRCETEVVALEVAATAIRSSPVPQPLGGGARYYTVAAPAAVLFVAHTQSLSDFAGDIAVRLRHPSGAEIGFADYFADQETLAVFADPAGEITPALRDLGLPAGTYAIQVSHKAGSPLFQVAAAAFATVPPDLGALAP